ncbi:MAG: hypothetical protein ACE5R3_02080 [Nitrosopumilaceae archaeon]
MELELGNDFLGNERNVKEFLKSLSDAKIKKFYEAIEYTPFPVLLNKEYKKRFVKNKSKTRKKRGSFQ